MRGFVRPSVRPRKSNSGKTSVLYAFCQCVCEGLIEVSRPGLPRVTFSLSLCVPLVVSSLGLISWVGFLMTAPPRTLGFFLQCNADCESTTWSCQATAELKLINHKLLEMEEKGTVPSSTPAATPAATLGNCFKGYTPRTCI